MACLVHIGFRQPWQTTSACDCQLFSGMRLFFGQIATPIIIPLCIPMTSAKSICRCHGRAVGLFSVRLWGFHVWFDATAPTRLNEQRRWLYSRSVFVSYHFLHSPNVTLLIYVRSWSSVSSFFSGQAERAYSAHVT